ncbi:unnamed protein product [Amoebophrya sp. A120]|nr:unnamed protein product [Amoebophrya sp. A120]|eukprot:GSA120T00023728001.1
MDVLAAAYGLTLFHKQAKRMASKAKLAKSSSAILDGGKDKSGLSPAGAGGSEDEVQSANGKGTKPDVGTGLKTTAGAASSATDIVDSTHDIRRAEEDSFMHEIRHDDDHDEDHEIVVSQHDEQGGVIMNSTNYAADAVTLSGDIKIAMIAPAHQQQLPTIPEKGETPQVLSPKTEDEEHITDNSLAADNVNAGGAENKVQAGDEPATTRSPPPAPAANDSGAVKVEKDRDFVDLFERGDAFTSVMDPDDEEDDRVQDPDGDDVQDKNNFQKVEPQTSGALSAREVEVEDTFKKNMNANAEIDQKNEEENNYQLSEQITRKTEQHEVEANEEQIPPNGGTSARLAAAIMTVDGAAASTSSILDGGATGSVDEASSPAAAHISAIPTHDAQEQQTSARSQRRTTFVMSIRKARSFPACAGCSRKRKRTTSRTRALVQRQRRLIKSIILSRPDTTQFQIQTKQRLLLATRHQQQQ